VPSIWTKWAAKTRILRQDLAQMVLLEAPVQPRGIIPLGGGHLGGTRKGAHKSLAAAANWLLLLTSAAENDSWKIQRLPFNCVCTYRMCAHCSFDPFPCAHKQDSLLTHSLLYFERAPRENQTRNQWVNQIKLTERRNSRGSVKFLWLSLLLPFRCINGQFATPKIGLDVLSTSLRVRIKVNWRFDSCVC